MNDTRRLYINNWAILAESDQVRWHFGDITEDKLHQTLYFVNALSKLGKEILGQVIGVIRLKYPRPHPTQAREIMVVNLLDRFTIVVSDPLVTTRLMNRIELDSDPIPPFDEIRSILAGAASVIYSQFYAHEEILEHQIVDRLFQEAVNAVTFDKTVNVGNGACSFSALSLEELLFFHALLKELFECYFATRFPGKPWGTISSITGAPLYLEHETPIDAAIISSFSSVIGNYCRFLFEATPVRLVFGVHPMAAMDFILTDENLFVLNNSKKLLKQQRFIRKWKEIPKDVAHDLSPNMKDYFAELLGQEQQETVKNMKFHQIINQLTGMGFKRARNYILP
ncbi:MAG: hypothetical protein ACFE95_05815 [Candidatus Hodarchaeota archaeon]